MKEEKYLKLQALSYEVRSIIVTVQETFSGAAQSPEKRRAVENKGSAVSAY